jgi:allantoinase
MVLERRYGMDHDHYTWSPIVKRAPFAWPGGARVAFCVIVNLECLDWTAPAGSYQPPLLYSHLAPMQRPVPESWTVSLREYGHRVGVFRLFDLLEKHGVRPTVAMDALTAANYPYLVRHCLQRRCEIIAHGVAVSRMITSRMSEDEERCYIRESIDAVAGATGTQPKGWHGPEYGESTLTPQLLAETGIRYVCDWANDEQPYRMTTPEGELYALPVMIELDDVFALRDRRFRVDDYAQQLKNTIDVLYRDAASTGRLFVLNLHAWLSGQPFRVRFLADAIAHIVRQEGVWAATGWEIIDWYRAEMATRDGAVGDVKAHSRQPGTQRVR